MSSDPGTIGPSPYSQAMVNGSAQPAVAAEPCRGTGTPALAKPGAEAPQVIWQADWAVAKVTSWPKTTSPPPIPLALQWYVVPGAREPSPTGRARSATLSLLASKEESTRREGGPPRSLTSSTKNPPAPPAHWAKVMCVRLSRPANATTALAATAPFTVTS